MIVFITYVFVFVSLTYYNGFFGLFKDEFISRKKHAFLLLTKALAVPVFFLAYAKLYGGIENFDTGKFYHDAVVINTYGKTDFGFFIRLLIGLQNDNPGSSDFNNCLVNTLNWDNGILKDYLYNDNRIVIRVHSLLHFIAFDSYLAHAFFNCFLSFIGIYFLYKTFKEWFVGKEMLVLLILCFWPALWFYTGALLKEGITLFIMGLTLYQLKRFINRENSFKSLAFLPVLIFISFLLKPYILIFASITFTLFFIYSKIKKQETKFLFFIGSFVLLVLIANGASLVLKDKSLLSAAFEQQHKFVGVSKGGVFVSDSIKLIRLTDTLGLEKLANKKDVFTIKKNIPYMYWQRPRLQDTNYVVANKDTATHYKLMYIIQEGNSNVHLSHKNSVYTAASALYYTLFYPSVFNAKSSLQFLASFENIVIIISLFLVCFNLIKSRRDKFLPFVFLFFCLSLCLLIGLTSPNSGAIFRYRSPAIIFLLMAALYSIDFTKQRTRFSD
ncbi:hypothetical protein [Aurantibacillus circumpalustris]|uniref:hypothetical protein n=1 Tax=Aurantibacillus circumpalustris TaxID=3036359 RepID=UPI00295A867D|nr:hypothetical protein [Aurantibacillus circumpalustris]